jgi:hypothetical protein
MVGRKAGIFVLAGLKLPLTLPVVAFAATALRGVTVVGAVAVVAPTDRIGNCAWASDAVRVVAMSAALATKAMPPQRRSRLPRPSGWINDLVKDLRLVDTWLSLSARTGEKQPQPGDDTAPCTDRRYTSGVPADAAIHLLSFKRLATSALRRRRRPTVAS